MNTKLLLSGVVRVLFRYRLRTFLMSIGVALGVAAVVAGRSVGSGAEREINEKVNRMFGSGTILVIAGSGGTGASTMKISDVEAAAEAVDEVLVWDPVVRELCEVSYGGSTRMVTISGHSDRGEQAWSRGVVDGRYIAREDFVSSARVALVGTRIAEHLFGEVSPIGEEILIKSVPFRVVGVLEPIGIDPHGEDRDEDVIVPTTTAMRRLSNVDYITMAKLVVRSPDLVEATSDEVEAILRDRHGILEGERSDFGIYTSKFAGQRVKEAMRVIKVYVPLAGGLILLVAAIVISTIMVTVVRGRIAEVGLRKAVGASEEQIGLQFLIEALALTVVSGAFGLALGVSVSVFAASRMHVEPVVTPGSILLGFGASIVVGVVSGLLPARRAARLDPVDALR